MTRYLYAGDDLVMELDGAGNPILEYTYLPGVDRPHSVRGSIRRALDAVVGAAILVIDAAFAASCVAG